MSPCLLFARMICGLQGARMCLSAESQQARVPSSIRKPNALSLFPAVFEPRSEGSVLAHTAPVNQVQGQSPFEWSVVLIMQPPFCPLLPSLHLLHPPAPPPPTHHPSKPLQSTWISFTQGHAITRDKETKGRTVWEHESRGSVLQDGAWGGHLESPTST